MTPRELIPALADAVALLDQACDRSAAYARRDGGSTARVDRLGATCEPIQPRAGFTLCAWVGGRLVERSCDDLTASAVAHCAGELAERARSLGAVATVRSSAPSEPTVRHFAHPQRSDARLVPAADKIAAARALRAELDGAEHLREAIAIVGDSHAEIVHVDRAHRFSQELHR
ncbi:MAG: hypothetical protein H0W72_17370, partial [Planctomycetes bacterium]|nr:hypothetical protein [Planctomycetota bacterium]